MIAIVVGYGLESLSHLLAVSVRLPAEENGKIGLLIIGVQISVFA